MVGIYFRLVFLFRKKNTLDIKSGYTQILKQAVKIAICVAPVTHPLTSISTDIKNKNISICLRINPVTGTG